MIKLKKGPRPRSLVDHSEKWTARIMKCIQEEKEIPDDLANAYNQPDIKESLERESYGKCMYCESKIAHIAYSHIEHFRPKSRHKFPELAFDWANLGLSCPKCNIKKGDHFEQATPYIDPYLDQPAIHFVGEGAFIWPAPGDKRAEITIDKMDLNRPELVEKRSELLASLRRLIRSYKLETVEALKHAFADEIAATILEHREYSFFASAHLELVKTRLSEP